MRRSSTARLSMFSWLLMPSARSCLKRRGMLCRFPVTYATGGLCCGRGMQMTVSQALRGRSKWQSLWRIPETAPYGTAAKEFLKPQGCWEDLSGSSAMGRTLMQTVQFVATGNADVGFIAASNCGQPYCPSRRCSWPVPVSSHSAIEQQAVLIARAERRMSVLLPSSSCSLRPP